MGPTGFFPRALTVAVTLVILSVFAAATRVSVDRTTGPAVSNDNSAAPASACDGRNGSRGLCPCPNHTTRIHEVSEMLKKSGDSPNVFTRGDDHTIRPGPEGVEDLNPPPAPRPAAALDPQTWTFLFYNDADFTNAYNPYVDFVQTAHSDTNVNVLMLEDRWHGPSRLWYVGTDRRAVVLENYGEVDMGHFGTLRDFIAYGKTHYPADRYFLAVYDHGGGWLGACSDATDNGWLSMNEISMALVATGGVDIIAFTAPCMMGALESAYQLRTSADVYIGSQDLSGYAAWHGIMGDICDVLNDSSGLTNTDIAGAVVDMVAANPYWGSQWFGGEEWITMSAVESARLWNLGQKVDVFSRYAATHMASLFDALKPSAWGAWKMGRNGEYNVGETDLYHFAQRFADRSADPVLGEILDDLMTAIDEAVIAEYHGWAQLHANGLSIYFPKYRADFNRTYATSNLHFVGNTGWDEFLQAFYTHQAKPVGAIAGAVRSNCGSSPTPLEGVTVTACQTSTGDLLGAAVTDDDGSYEITGLVAGNFVVEAYPPLGYAMSAGGVDVMLMGGVVSGIDLSLVCIGESNNPRGTSYWKRAVGEAMGGGGQVLLDASEICACLDAIDAHFTSRGIMVYAPAAGASCDSKLAAAADILHPLPPVRTDGNARSHLMALMLNVAAGNMRTDDVISKDGATVSQAIFYCNELLDTRAVDALVIANLINNGVAVPPDWIPRSTPDIAYAPGAGDSAPPHACILEQNVPNPFNPTTTISFVVPERAATRVRVFDIRGRLVITLVDEALDAGPRSVTWNGKDSNGNPVSSGIYFYRLDTGGQQLTKKMLLLK